MGKIFYKKHKNNHLLMKKLKMRKVFIITIDGQSGSGKTTLANSLYQELKPVYNTFIFKLEHIYPGWQNLAKGVSIYNNYIFDSIYYKKEIIWQKWNWRKDSWHDKRLGKNKISMKNIDIAILEGVGANNRKVLDAVDLSIWLEDNEYSRKTSAMNRKFDQYTNLIFWDIWKKQELCWLIENNFFPKFNSDILILRSLSLKISYFIKLIKNIIVN